MAKVSILTFHYANNPGAVLQAYGLVQAVRGLGHEVTMLDYRPLSARRYYDSHWLRYPLSFARHPVRFLRTTAIRLTYNRFRTNHLPLSRKYLTPADLHRHPPDADHVICGSDQVWNIASFRGFDPVFFLDLPGGIGPRRISYAASFGKADDLGPHRQRIVELLSQFDALSVRDMKSRRMVEALTGRAARHVLDPCFLTDYAPITPPPRVKPPYILLYYLGMTPLAVAAVRALRRHFNLPVIAIDAPIAGATTRYPGPRQWLSLMRHARFVCTNSFHGTCFSLINRKPFIMLPNEGGMARLEDILDTAGLSSRLVRDSHALAEVAAAPVDYREVSERIDAARLHSIAFLREALG